MKNKNNKKTLETSTKKHTNYITKSLKIDGLKNKKSTKNKNKLKKQSFKDIVDKLDLENTVKLFM